MASVEDRLASLERRVATLTPYVGPTTDYKSVQSGVYLGTAVREGIIDCGGGGLGPTTVIRLFDTGGHLIGWLGSDVDSTGMLHVGAWIRDLLVSGTDETNAAMVGGFSNFVSTDESTSSTSYVDLTTFDQVTINLGIATKLSIDYLAAVYNSSANPGSLFNIVNIDGADIVGTDASVTLAAGAAGASTEQYVATLAAGVHVIKIRHKVSAFGVVGHWLNRMLKVVPVS